MRALSGWGLGLLAAALLLSGCGQGSASPPSAIRFESPAVGANGVISPRINCGSGTIWLPMKWSSLPSGSKELVLYFGRYKNETEGGSRKVVVPFAAVITDIEPSTTGIKANTYPAGAEPSYFTVNNCQPKREGQDILAVLFALDHSEHAVPYPPSRRFVTEIAEEALGVGEFAGDSEAETPLSEESLATGHFTSTYGPKPK